jgi:hypothetical protein
LEKLRPVYFFALTRLEARALSAVLLLAAVSVAAWTWL